MLCFASGLLGPEVLGTRDHDLIGVPVADREHPGAAPLLDHLAGLAVEPPVRHPLLNRGLADDVDCLPGLEPLDQSRHGSDAALSEIFLELIPCLLSWTVVVCHRLLPPSGLGPGRRRGG